MLAVQHLQKFIDNFHKDNPNKPIARSLIINTVLLMFRITKPLITKEKHGKLAKTKSIDKHTKKLRL